jgi:hypothetical protein
MRSYMEMIYIDTENLARQTGLQRSGETDAATWAEFQSYRLYEVDIKQARFLLDYHNRKGDLGPTIPLDNIGFAAITGAPPKSDAAYRKIDADFWREVRAQRAA